MIASRKFFGQVVHVEAPGTPIMSAAGFYVGSVKAGTHYVADSGIWTTAEGYAEMTKAYQDAGAQIFEPGDLICG